MTADDAFEAGAQDGAEVPAPDETARRIARVAADQQVKAGSSEENDAA